MTDTSDDYVYDEASGEWISPAEAAANAHAAEAIEVRDSVGNLLADGDSVITIKDLKVKGAGQTLRKGTVIKSIRLTGDAQEIDCRYDGIKGLVLRAEFVRKHLTDEYLLPWTICPAMRDILSFACVEHRRMSLTMHVHRWIMPVA